MIAGDVTCLIGVASTHVTNVRTCERTCILYFMTGLNPNAGSIIWKIADLAGLFLRLTSSRATLLQSFRLSPQRCMMPQLLFLLNSTGFACQRFHTFRAFLFTFYNSCGTPSFLFLTDVVTPWARGQDKLHHPILSHEI